MACSSEKRLERLWSQLEWTSCGEREENIVQIVMTTVETDGRKYVIYGTKWDSWPAWSTHGV